MTEESENHSIEPELEARIVALVCGEASDFERDALNRLMEQQPHLAAFRDEMQSVHEMLSDVGEGEFVGEDEEWKLSPGKRKSVLAVLNGEEQRFPVTTADPVEGGAMTPPPPRNMWKFTGIAVAACACGFAYLMFDWTDLFESSAPRIVASHEADEFNRPESPARTSDLSLVEDSMAPSNFATPGEIYSGSVSGDESREDSDAPAALLAIRQSLEGQSLQGESFKGRTNWMVEDFADSGAEAGRLAPEFNMPNAGDGSVRFDLESMTDESSANGQGGYAMLDGDLREEVPAGEPTFGGGFGVAGNDKGIETATADGGMVRRREFSMQSGGYAGGEVPAGGANGTAIDAPESPGMPVLPGPGGGTPELLIADVSDFDGLASQGKPAAPFGQTASSEGSAPAGAVTESDGKMSSAKNSAIVLSDSATTGGMNSPETFRKLSKDELPKRGVLLGEPGPSVSGPGPGSGPGVAAVEAKAKSIEIVADLALPVPDSVLRIEDEVRELESVAVTGNSGLKGDNNANGIRDSLAGGGQGFGGGGFGENAQGGQQMPGFTNQRDKGTAAPAERGAGSADDSAPDFSTRRDEANEAGGREFFSREIRPERVLGLSESIVSGSVMSEESPTDLSSAVARQKAKVPPVASAPGSDAPASTKEFAKSGQQRSYDDETRKKRAATGKEDTGGWKYRLRAGDALDSIAMLNKSMKKLPDGNMDIAEKAEADVRFGTVTEGSEESDAPETDASETDGAESEISSELGLDSDRKRFQEGQRDHWERGGRNRWDGYVPPESKDVSSSKKAQERRVAPPASLAEKTAEQESFSTFSLHVSDVSFKLAQAALAQGEWPESAKIRIEEFVNAMDYGDPLPAQGEKVACRVEQSIHPFLQQRNLLRVAMRTGAAGRASTTPLRLTLLLDNSGSMERTDRQQTVRRAFALLALQLQPTDQVTLISFARRPRLLADKVSGDQAGRLVGLIDSLPREGGTNLESALQLAYEKAHEQRADNAQNRIILLTDGAVNLGDAEPESLSRRITMMRDSGIAFDAAGISAEGLNDEVLEALARKGDGRYYMLDSVESADSGFARQIAGALRPSAKNVKVQVEFNPNRVGRYKLLGFEKHRLKKEDFRNDAVDAAEMAAAEAGVAMYQFEAKPDGEGDVGSVSVRFQDLSSGQMVEHCWPIPYEASAPRPDQATPSMRIATSTAMLASKLKGGPLAESVDLKTLANLIAGLPELERSRQRVQQLQVMIHQARQIIGQ